MNTRSVGFRSVVYVAGLLVGVVAGACLVVFVLHWPPSSNAIFGLLWGGIWTRLTLVRWADADGAR